MEKVFDYKYLGKDRERRVTFNTKGLSETEASLVEDIGTKVIKGAKDRDVLNRCTFFAEPGLEILEEVTSKIPEVKNQEIRGCDKNPYDQHYWLQFTLGEKQRKIIIDPIFGYVGLLRHSSSWYKELYYSKSRHVLPNKHISEGGVRVNTNGVP